MNRRTALSGLAASGMVSAVGLPAWAKTTIEKVKITGVTATAQWLYVDGGITYNIFVSAARSAVKEIGQPRTSQPILQLGIVRGFADSTSSAYLGDVTNFTFTVANDLSSARIIGSVPVIDRDTLDPPFTALVDLTFTATSPLMRDKCHIISHEGPVRFKQKLDDKHRTASVTGSIIGLGRNLVPSDPAALLDAVIHDVKAGTMTITHD